MKKYDLNIDFMREEGYGDISEMFSKGHHEEKEFKNMCKLTYIGESGVNNEECSFIDDAKLYHKWGKIVGWFEDGKRLGWTISESKEYKKGYFPMTKINV